MGFRDTIEGLKDRFLRGNDDEYYDEYEEDYFDEGFDEEGDFESVPENPRLKPITLPDQRGSGVLGNSSRPEAESVSVRTRSGDPVLSAPSPSVGGYTSPTSFAGDSYRNTAPAPGAGMRAPGAPSLLPPTVMKPAAYNDIQPIIRRIRTNQPVVLDLRHTPVPEAKRILDFCFGMALGMEGAMEELDDRVFVMLPTEEGLSVPDRERLVRDGIIRR